MFGIGVTELIVILVIAIIFIGPKKLPEIAKAAGKAFAEFKKATEDIKNSVKEDIEKTTAPLTELSKEVQAPINQKPQPSPKKDT
ncbi:MAG: Sec-independent protein translocase protein TatB [Deltaproteobacteria bacterium]